MTEFTKDGGIKCPACAETIKVDALVCKHCGQQFSAEEVKSRKDDLDARNRKGCLGCAALLIPAILALSFCTADNESDPNTAESREKGFHCLGSWDGSHRQFVQMVKENLRDPDSFEHVETRVSPERNGRHRIVMTYRARNGFGGTNLDTASGSYSNTDCEPVIKSIGSL